MIMTTSHHSRLEIAAGRTENRVAIRFQIQSQWNHWGLVEPGTLGEQLLSVETNGLSVEFIFLTGSHASAKFGRSNDHLLRQKSNVSSRCQRFDRERT
jgi:hypothetical protein